MSYMNKKSIMNRLQENYEFAKDKANGEIFAIFLQGSQNYIDDKFLEESDVDSRAVYIPNKKDVCLGKDISLPTLVLDNGEHIDRFDIRKFLKLIKTPGISNYENLYTEYYVINPKYKKYHNDLMKIREHIVHFDEKKFLMATMGVSKRHLDDLQSRNGGEEYDIDNFGYSRKRLANIIRLNETVKAYLDDKPFSECLKSMDQNLIYKIRKTECYTLNQALELAEKVDKETKELAYNFKSLKNKDYQKISSELDEIFVNLMVEGMKI